MNMNTGYLLAESESANWHYPCGLKKDTIDDKEIFSQSRYTTKQCQISYETGSFLDILFKI